jgi:hypothetical protein
VRSAQIASVAEITAAAHDILGLRHLDHAAADIAVAGADRGGELRKREAVGLQFLGIDDDLVLLDEAADACHFGDPSGLGQLIAQIPVLDRAQLGERALGAEHHILIDPADTGRVGPERRGDALGQALGGKIEIFEDARARPIKIGAVLEHDINEGHAEERKAAHHLGARHGEQRRVSG